MFSQNEFAATYSVYFLFVGRGKAAIVDGFPFSTSSSSV